MVRKGRPGYWVVGGKHAGKGPFYGTGESSGGDDVRICCCVFIAIITIAIIIALITK